MATTAEVRDRSANLLGILRFGQSLQSQDSTRITTAYNEVYQQLKTDGLATWTSTGDIPTDLVPHIVALVAWNCIDDYGVSNDRYIRIEKRVLMAPKAISKLVTEFYASQDEPTDY